MSNQFKARLKQIRDDSERRSEASHKARSHEDMERSQKTFDGFEFREKVEAIIEELAAGFCAEASGFELSRGFYEGKYQLALRLEEPLTADDGSTENYFSRLVFLLDPHIEDDILEVQCRKTIRNRDLESTSHSYHMVISDLESIEKYIENQFVSFAESYFDSSALRPAGAPS
ncbi:MAG: hypothetical protein ACI9EF_000271 [Pseudohongiellaceae bacterium]|jgi:hypothetical protein